MTKKSINKTHASYKCNSRKIVGDLIDNSATHILSQIINKSKSIEYLNQYLRSKLTPEIAAHCWISSGQNPHILYIYTDSAAWKHQLSALKSEILKIIKLDCNFKQFKQLEFKILPELLYINQNFEVCYKPEKNYPENSSFRQEAKNNFHQAAALTSCAKLKDILQKIADKLV